MPSVKTKKLESGFIRAMFWTLFFIAQLLACSLLVWETGVQFNFGYSLGYKLLNINEHIQTYAPQNKYKSDFVFTSENERRELFEQTVEAIENNGEGLEKITYEMPNRTQVSLYTPAEILHLKDVSHLVNKFLISGFSAFLIWIAGLFIIRRYKLGFPSAKVIALGASLLSILICLSLFLMGPTNVFYWLHTKIFPENHQWYFYYQESLMATFMKAPDLFGLIGALLGVGLILFFLGASFLGKSISQK